jgi:hypothetical protein
MSAGAKTILLLLVGCAVALLMAMSPASRETRSWQVDLRPGDSFSVPMTDRMLLVQVPTGPDEASSIGTFRLRTEGYDSGPLQRDGMVESIFCHDANGDAQDDATLVIRSAGSGGYVTIISLLSGPDGYRIYHPPEPAPESLLGYQGHDGVTVSGTTLTRSYPSYVDSPAVRVDRQWSPTDLVKNGTSPIKAVPDCNAAPSGCDEAIHFSFASETWN